MASKKQSIGKSDFDDDLDFDFDAGSPDNLEISKNDRKPISTAVRSAAAGFGKSFLNESQIRKSLGKALPKEYEEPLTTAFEIKNGARDLYNGLNREVRETVIQGKRGANRIVKNLESVLPRSVYEKLDKMTKTEDRYGSSGVSKEEVENQQINSAFAEIFAADMKNRADQEKQQKADKAISDTIERKRHGDMIGLLGSIDQSLLDLRSFQDKIGVNYMKKSLELQFRSYFLQGEMLQLQTKYFQDFANDLGAITKNTGLPDFVKKATKESLQEHMRAKVFDSLAQTLNRKRQQYLGGVVKRGTNMIKRAGSAVRDTMGQLMDVGEMASQAIGMSKEFGGSPGEMVGEMVGGGIGNQVQNWAAGKLRPVLEQNKNMVKVGNKATLLSQNLPQATQDWVRNSKWLDKKPTWLRNVLSELLTENTQEGTRIDTSREIDLERATQFSEKSARSLNVVIPQLLSMIHRELYVTRTGDDKAQPISYDYETGKFVKKADRQSRLLQSIVSKDETERTSDQFDALLREIDPDGKLDKKERAALARELYSQNRAGTFFNKKEIHSDTFLQGIHGGDKAKGLIQDYIGKDDLAIGERRFAKLAARIGGNNGDKIDLIQALVDSGRGGELAELGLYDPEKGEINVDAIRDLQLGTHSKLSKSKDIGFSKGGYTGPGNKNWPKGVVHAGEVVWSQDDIKRAGGLDVVERLRQGDIGLPGYAKGGFVVSQTKAKSKPTQGSESLLAQIRDVLLRIEEKGAMGGINLTEEAMARIVASAEGFKNQLFKKVTGGIGKLGKGFFNLAERSSRFSADITGKALKGFGKATAWGFDKLNDYKEQFNLFVGDEIEPRLKKFKLEAGRYIDVNTNKVITKYEDITGDIRDLDTDEIVLYAHEIKNSILKNFDKTKSILGKATKWGSKAIKGALESAKKSIQNVMGLGRGITGLAYSLAKKAYNEYLDGPADVYVGKDAKEPTLLKRTMAAGLYFDQRTYDTITKVSQIQGAVVDNNGDVVLSTEDLKKGLYDKNGREIKTGFMKIAQLAKESIGKTFGRIKRFGQGLLDKGKELFGGAYEFIFGGKSPFVITSRKTNEILTDILDLLIARLPEHKRVLGDSDGDGIRDGSYEDIVARRKEAKEKEREKQEGKAGRNGILGGALGKLLDRFEKKDQEEEDEDDDDGDSYYIDNSGEKKKKTKAPKGKKPRGRIGRGWDKLKGKVGGSKFGKGLGRLAGKVAPKGGLARAGGSMLARAGGWGLRTGLGVGRFALTSLLAGGIGSLSGIGALGTAASAIGGAAMAGLGAVGTALGAGATALAGVLTAPVLLTGLAVAGAGALTYYGYKALTTDKPGDIGKVRLVQYGWKADDIDTYQKVVALEAKVKPAIVWDKEGKASFDASKLNIQDCMKIFDLDPNNPDHAKKFVDWFANRFKPIFLNDTALGRAVGFDGDLKDIDDKLKPEQKLAYLKDMLNPGEHYGIVTSPLKDQQFLPMSMGSVERQIEAAKAEIEKNTNKPANKQAAKDAVAKTTAALASGKMQDVVEAAKAEEKADKKATVGVPSNINTGQGASTSNASGGKLAAMAAGSAAMAANGAPSGEPGSTYQSQAASNGAPSGEPGGPQGSGYTQPAKSKPYTPKPTPEAGQKVKAVLLKDMPKFGITTPNQQAAFLGNIEHESNFMPVSENLNYKPQRLMQVWPNRFKTLAQAQAVAAGGPQGIANSIYNGRMGNATGSNDGWDYRGRGPIQITGKNNYSAISKLINKDIVDNPDLVTTDPQVSADTAMAYWKMNPSLGKLADAGQFAEVRRRVNGGGVGMEDALSRMAKYKELIESGQIKIGAGATQSGNSDPSLASNLAGPASGAPSGEPAATPTANQQAIDADLEKRNQKAFGPSASSASASGDTSIPASAASTSGAPASDPIQQAAPVASASAPVVDPYYAKANQVNVGDLKPSIDQQVDLQKTMVSQLESIVEALKALPEALAGNTTPAPAPEPKPTQTPQATQPVRMGGVSKGYRRALAGA